MGIVWDIREECQMFYFIAVFVRLEVTLWAWEADKSTRSLTDYLECGLYLQMKLHILFTLARLRIR